MLVANTLQSYWMVDYVYTYLVFLKILSVLEN